MNTMKRSPSQKRLADDAAYDYNSSDYSSGGEDDGEGTSSPTKVAKKIGAKKSEHLPIYHLCGFMKANGKYCGKQLINGSEVVCTNHIMEATAKVPALVSVLKEARAKYLNPKNGNLPKSSEAKMSITNIYYTYRKTVKASRRALNGEGVPLAVEGMGYTWDAINFFDEACNNGVRPSGSAGELYNQLVSRRRNYIQQRIVELQTELEGLHAEFRNYASISEMEALQAEAPAGGASTSAAAAGGVAGGGIGNLSPSLEMEDAMMGEDRADSD